LSNQSITAAPSLLSDFNVTHSVDLYASYVRRLVDQGGPREVDYADLDHWVIDVYDGIRAGQLSTADIAEIRAAFGEALSSKTMQGFALTKPHGYAGDFEMIDRIYQIHIAPQSHLASWDRFYHQHAAPKAVRNRKKYFHRLLDKHWAARKPLRVLKIASGPGRCMFEWLTAHPDASVSFDCVEIDPAAIEYASRLNRRFLDRIAFTQKNALRVRPSREYDIIWAAGIFDYFDDKVFKSLFSRLLPALAPGGEIVVGNFSDRNPSRAYMELVGQWTLHHRAGHRLVSLAAECGVSSERITVRSEPEQVNYFLHARSDSLVV
jgi:extracellular factor (EF) 3-hydroxypalmitic acid methyl ester biosynthesis protein